MLFLTEKFFKLIGRHRLSEEVALCPVAARFLEYLCLSGSFYALGNSLDLLLFCDSYNCGNYLSGYFIFFKIHYKRAVQLQQCNWKHLDIAQ